MKSIKNEKNIIKMYTYVAKNLITIAIWQTKKKTAFQLQF